MTPGEYDVVIVGAGAAGLAALAALDRADLNVLCLEARDRIGGRVYTVHDRRSGVPLELGAEFIHGQSPEIWDIVRAHGLLAFEIADTAVSVKDGKVQQREDGWELINEVVEEMQAAAAKEEDQSFSSFLEKSSRPRKVKRLALSYVEGFNAARGELVSIRALAQEGKAADKIDGNRSFRFLNGYSSLIEQIVAGVQYLPSKLRVNSVVDRILWRRGQASVDFRSAITGQRNVVRAQSVIVTAPLGALQAGGIVFEPEPDDILRAAHALEFGQVMRVVLRFREAFWEEDQELAGAGFLLSDERSFPTWWTPLPVRAPVLVGWCAGPHTDDLLGKPRSEIIGCAVADLSRIAGLRQSRVHEMLEAAYFHDWHADPCAHGAYSYVPVGALGARAALAQPVAETLYFAGEATEFHGHSATVHGAIASGKRAAGQIISRRRSP
jgi:monoamine oxidase